VLIAAGMKKTNSMKPRLSAETIRRLEDTDLRGIAGGKIKTGDAPCGPTAFCSAQSECGCTLLC
jgi:hypothetical protein